MSSTYNADAIEVLTGLDPVRKRPGMYTDTTRPNHLVQEVIDNSVDEALAGHARTLTLVLEKDGFVEVTDDGRGMPVDKHKGEKVSDSPDPSLHTSAASRRGRVSSRMRPLVRAMTMLSVSIRLVGIRKERGGSWLQVIAVFLQYTHSPGQCDKSGLQMFRFRTQGLQ